MVKPKKSLVGWILQGIADTIIIYKGARLPYPTAKEDGCKKVRITIQEL